ncbi:RodZ domain-containing protein [Lysobacter sp. A3-1-A15]|uniref:RodZ domain-containing protein n=1 Tax=Novilysobacter viscosus TaxID=3098602 RepID=UPI002ED8FBCA
MTNSNEIAPGCDGCGSRLRAAREAAGFTHEDVAARLKMPVRVVRALEADDWRPLGAPVFVRGQLRSYARLLGLDIEQELLRSPIEPVAQPELVSHTHVPRYRVMGEQMARRAVYVVLTVAIALPVWLATRPHLSEGLAVESLDPSPGIEAAPGTAPKPDSAPAVRERTPIVASMASLPPRSKAAAPAVTGLSLRFSDDSWVQVFSAQGEALEQGMMESGQRLSYDKGEVGRVVLGNSAAVEARRGGELIDLEPFSRANVARFTLSSDGSLAPVRD